MSGESVLILQSTSYLLLVIFQVPESLGTGAQLDEKTTSGDPLDINREYLQLKLSFYCSVFY